MDDFRRDRAANHGQAAGGGMADRNGVIFESAFYHKLYDAAMKRGKLAPLFDRQTDRGAMIRLRTLQHMNVIHLRMRLAQEVAAMKRNGTTDYDQMEHVSRLMKRYIDALRDLKFMLEKTSEYDRVAEFLRDLFYINAKDDGAILRHADLARHNPPHTHWETELSVPNYTGYKGYSHGIDTTHRNFMGFMHRLKMAILAGLALIVPMLIMRLHPTLLTQLLTTSLFILAFGVVLSIYLNDADETYIASATAAYAAVLVVFVGTSSSS